MAGCLFHIILYPFRLLGIFIAKGISFAVGSAVKANDRKWDKKLEQEYLSDPTPPEKLQKKMNTLFYSRWATKILSFLLMAAIAIPFIALAAQGSMDGDEFFPILFPCILIAVVGFLLYRFTKGIATRTKRLAGLIARPILQEFFGENARYEAGKRITNDVIASSGFLHGYKWAMGSDLVSGQYKGNPIMFSDIELVSEEERTGADGETETKTETIFRGYWIVMDFDRELTQAALNIHEERNPDAIQMESMLFNDKFSVYCPDELTAFYVITPDFMERLLRIEKNTNGRMRFQFSKNRLQIAVDTRSDNFEVGSFSLPNVEALQLQFRDEVRQITSVLDEMLKHEKLFGDSSANN